jgi:hypothetical protein
MLLLLLLLLLLLCVFSNRLRLGKPKFDLRGRWNYGCCWWWIVRNHFPVVFFRIVWIETHSELIKIYSSSLLLSLLLVLVLVLAADETENENGMIRHPQ